MFLADWTGEVAVVAASREAVSGQPEKKKEALFLRPTAVG
jgi:hypothetical protein